MTQDQDRSPSVCVTHDQGELPVGEHSHLIREKGRKSWRWKFVHPGTPLLVHKDSAG
jgi:hypothetical protein